MLGSGVIVKFQTGMRRCLYKFLLNRTIMHPARPSLHKLYSSTGKLPTQSGLPLLLLLSCSGFHLMFPPINLAELLFKSPSLSPYSKGKWYAKTLCHAVAVMNFPYPRLNPL